MIVEQAALRYGPWPAGIRCSYLTMPTDGSRASANRLRRRIRSIAPARLICSRGSESDTIWTHFAWPSRTIFSDYRVTVKEDGAAGRGTRVETSRPLQDDDCCIDPREVPWRRSAGDDRPRIPLRVRGR